MSPEQAEGRKDIGPATDVWALGVILYELLVGRTPFQGVTLVDTLEQVRTREPVPPTQLQPKVPTDLETICLKCLRKEPAQRYGTADELAEDLRRFLDGEPVRARPVGLLARSLRWCRRNPRLAGLGAAVLLLLLTIAVTSTAFAFVLDARRREIEKAWHRAEEQEGLARRSSRQATESAREADQRYQLLHEALTVVIDRVQQDLKPFPETGTARRQILEATMKVLRRSVAQGRDSSRQPERSLAAAHMLMGDLLLEAKDTREAIRHYKECHDILTVLYRSNPESDKAALNYAASLSRQGDVALDHRHDAAEALRLYREALALQEHFRAHPPAKPELTPTEELRSLANSEQRIAEILLRSQPRALAEARGYFERARDHFDRVVLVEGTAGNHLRVKQVCFQLGQLNERLDRPDDARRAFERCLEACRRLVEANPGDAEYPILIARLCGKVGDAYLFAGATPRAKRFYHEAVSTNEGLVRRDKQPGLRLLLSLNYYRRATASLRLGDGKAADSDYKKCLDLRAELQRRFPTNLDLRIDLMIAQGRCGLHREAAAFAKKLRQDFADKPTHLLHAACGYALSAFGVAHGKDEGSLTAAEGQLRQEYCDRAVEALRQAKAQGYKDVRNLQAEPDLDPIRQDKGFRQLMGEYAVRPAKR
jgi:tetratricopeptide (TPR) repeat protein